MTLPRIVETLAIHNKLVVSSKRIISVLAGQGIEGFKSPPRILSCVKVSVVICTYTLNMYEHFREAADSVLAQTYDDVELIVIVDGTPDVYERVIDDYGDHKDMIVECNDENLGLLQSRNRGVEIASGDVVAFIDDDAIADEMWVERLVRAYEERNAIAAGGKMTPKWVAGKPSFLPEEFYWLVGVTHRGFADGSGEVRNTFGSNISFRTNVFEELGGFDVDIGGRKVDQNLQGGETELCARMRQEYGNDVWYNPEAEVAHKVFDYRTKFWWLIDRAFWQGYSKRAMETLVADSSDEEATFLKQLLFDFIPNRFRSIFSGHPLAELAQLGTLLALTTIVGVGYIYGILKW
jgi:glycosyltransferase involved in cell wall biosynthesis